METKGSKVERCSNGFWAEWKRRAVRLGGAPDRQVGGRRLSCEWCEYWEIARTWLMGIIILLKEGDLSVDYGLHR
jgi:hypothetical protein